MSQRGGGRRGGGGRGGGGGGPRPSESLSPSLGSSRGGGGRGGRGGGRGGRGRGRASTPGESSGSTSYAPVIASSSSRGVPQSTEESPESPQVSVSALASDLQKQLTVAAPSSSRAIRFARRPGFGTVGRKIVVRANHFFVELAAMDLHHYDVSISPAVTSKKTNRNVISKLEASYKQSHLGGRVPAYDGMKSIYTVGPLPFQSKEFVVILDDEEATGSGSSSSSSVRKDRQFKVAIKFASKPDIHHLREFLRGRQTDFPQETIQALDVVLRMTRLNEGRVVVGRSLFFNDTKGALGEGVEYWRGYYQSLRPTQMGLSLNIDISATSFYEPLVVTEFVQKYLYIRDLSRPLSDQDIVRVKRALKSVRVKSDHLSYPRRYKIKGISNCPISQLKFSSDDTGAQMSVVQYFRERYKISLRYISLPALQVGSESKPIYLPMELCSIEGGQRYTRKLSANQVKTLLKATCQRPEKREKDILEIVRHNVHEDKDFGIRVKRELTSVNARVLPPPMLKYHDTGREKSVDPQLGAWNMIGKKMINGGKVDSWAFVNFSRDCDRHLPQEFCTQLIAMCNSKGMQFSQSPVVAWPFCQSTQIEETLRNVHRAGKQLQLLIIILPDISGSYGKIKRLCETELGIVSQCCQPKQAFRLNKQYMENIALKINNKVGGRNWSLCDSRVARGISYVQDVPTIIFGADVTHPSPGEDTSPSIAAVVASMDWPEVTKYRATCSAQPHRQEIIQDLYRVYEDSRRGIVHGGFIRELLVGFYQSLRQKPKRIIFYRDGVSEGQFSQVLYYEMDAIRKACASLEEGYLPPVTFIVVQKRHHTRLFPSDYRRRDLTDKSSNIQPGTVVDTEICHPSEFDFYLNSHAGIQGTSRPTHYHVLYDENNFTADAVQLLSNSLCYSYARCTRSVSIVPAVYYAHLMAFRARYYMEGETSDAGSSGGGSSSGQNVAVQSLPAIRDNVKNVMFYC